MDVLLMFLQPRVHGTACLPNVDIDALTGDSVYTRCPKSRSFLGRQAHRFDVVPGQHCAGAVEYRLSVTYI
jgi:hypothetical protein